jgi:hypothetical protein
MRKFIQILILVLLTGCGIFALREAEEPEKPPLWNNFYTTWELALKNLEYGYEDERNLTKFGEMLTSDFRFYFAPQDVNDYNISGIWTRDNERDMLYNLHSVADSVLLELMTIPEQNDDVQSTPIKLYRSYVLTIKKDLTVRTYVGRMELQMRQENGFWRIVKWYDYREATPFTWGKMKYDYSV